MKADNLQRAIYTALTNDAPLMAMIVDIYAAIPQPDTPEQNADFPYVVIGKDTFTGLDTKTDNGVLAVAQIDVWSRQRNLTEAKAIGSAIYAVLQKGDLTIAGASHIATRSIGAAYSIDPDGITNRGLLTFGITYDEI